jgi:hypothetical protein
MACRGATLKFMEIMMRRITILGRNLKDKEIEQIKRLAEDVGMNGDEIELVDAIGEPDPDCEDEIVLILASPETCADPALETDLAITQRGGRRAPFACGRRTRHPTPSRRTP